MDEFTTDKGEVVRVGDLFRDAKRAEPRTLRVVRIEHLMRISDGVEICDIGLSILDDDGRMIRATQMTAKRLLSAAFVRAEEVRR